MSPDHAVRFLDILPLLPASVASIYLAFVARTRCQPLSYWHFARAIEVNENRNLKLPVHVVDTSTQSTPANPSDRYTTALQLVHQVFTASTLFRLNHVDGRLDATTCLTQLGLVAAEFAIRYARRAGGRQDELMLLGAAWVGMSIQSMCPPIWSSAAINAVSSSGIGILGIAAILPSTSSVISDTKSTDERSKKPAILHSSDPDVVERPSQHSLVHYHIFSVSILLTTLFRKYPSTTLWLTQFAPWSASYSHLLTPFLLILVRDFLEEWHKSRQSSQTLSQHLKTFGFSVTSNTPDYIHSGFIIPLLTIVPFCILFFITSFLSSCLGFRRLILGLPRTAPTLWDGGMSGGFMFQLCTCGNLLYYRKSLNSTKHHSTVRLNLVFITAFGQTVASLVIFAFLLYVAYT